MLLYIVSLEQPISFARPREIFASRALLRCAYTPKQNSLNAQVPQDGSDALGGSATAGGSAPMPEVASGLRPRATTPAQNQPFAHISSPNPPRINTSGNFVNFCISLIPNNFKPTRINTSGAKDLKSIRINTSGNKDLKSFRINTSKKQGRGEGSPRILTSSIKSCHQLVPHFRCCHQLVPPMCARLVTQFRSRLMTHCRAQSVTNADMWSRLVTQSEREW